MNSKTSGYYNNDRAATESDPLLLSPLSPSSFTIRERRPAATATTTRTSSTEVNVNICSTGGTANHQHFNTSYSTMSARNNGGESHSVEGERNINNDNPSRSEDRETVNGVSYEIYNQSTDNVRSMRSLRSQKSLQMSRGSFRGLSERGGRTDRLHDYYNERAQSIFSERSQRDAPLMGVSPEILSIRKRALSVYEPLTYTWLIFTFGFSICASLSMAKWTGLLPKISYWFLLLPCWSSHIGLFMCHIYSAKTLFTFINEANNLRLRPDSTDHLDRTEYLPLLQKALKFGLKTGGLSLLIFIFEILLYIRIIDEEISMTLMFTPIWIIVGVGIIDGIICKTQHVTRVFSWFLALSFMILMVLKYDYNLDEDIQPQIILGTIVAMLAMAIGSLYYILHGHRIGYFHLSASQSSAGILYLLGIIGFSVLFVMCTAMHMARPNIFIVRVIMVALAPLSVALMGLGAWAISRDEFELLLQYGGQSSIQPKKLRLEKSGWTTVIGKGATNIPMFGEVRFEPLDPSTRLKVVKLCCMCCTCYQYADEEEGIMHNSDNISIS